MGLSNLIDKMFKKDSLIAEPEPIIKKSQDEQPVLETDAYDPFSDPVRLALNVPEVLPCLSDVTIEFWIKRLQFWGKPKIIYIDPDGKRKNISVEEFEKAMTEPEEVIRVFGQWTMNKKSVKSFEATREFTDATGRKRKETYKVDIDLHKDLVDYFKGKF